MSDSDSKTRWHLLLGKLLECLLTPVDIQVQVEPQLMSEPPRGDIILLRRNGKHWTAAQQARLADGIRDSTAAHILLEFKYTESVNRDAIQQILGYEHFYRRAQTLKADEIAGFLISSKTPQAATLAKYGYEKTAQAGIYRSNQWLLQPITLISLNDLANSPHNAWLRIFASKQQEQQKAFAHVQQAKMDSKYLELHWFVRGLLKLAFGFLGEQHMKIEVTPEDVVEIGKWLEGTPLGESMREADLLYHFQQLPIEKRLDGVALEERIKGFAPEEVFSQFAPEERLKGLAPEERFKGLEPEVIEAYLKKIREN